jgi:hypothetical protein
VIARAGLAAGWVALAALSAAAADPYSVRAYVEPAGTITETTEVRLVIEVLGASTPSVTPPRIGDLKNLTLAGGPQTSSRFSWTNGRASSSYQLVYSLLPEQPGPAAVPALEVGVDSRVYRTAPIEFRVERASDAPQVRAPGRAAAGTEGDEAALVLRAELGASEVWVGEPVALDVILFSTARVSGFGWRKRPDFANFWVEPVESDVDSETYRTRIGNRVYIAYPVERQLLIAPGPGDYELEPYIAQIQVRSGRDDPFDWFQLGRSESVLRKTAPQKLKVRALPEAGRPANFGGAVGSYSLRVQLDRDTTRTNDAVALTATVQGEGVLRSVEPPALELPADFKVFEPRLKESVVRAERGRVVSRRTWEWILIPLAPGEARLPGLSFPYFDPAQAAYRSATSEPLLLVVERGEAADDPGTARADVRLQRRDLAFIKFRRGELAENHPRAHRTGLFAALLVLPAALGSLYVLIERRRFRLQRDVGLARSRKARARARRRILASRKHLEDNRSPRFHEEVGRALVEYVADRFNRSPAGLTYDLADALLASHGADLELRRRFRACLEACDFARFVPAAAETSRRNELIGEASELVDRLERVR